MSRLGRSTDKKGFIFSLDKPPVEPGWRRINGQCIYTPTCDYGGGDCYATQAECLATLSSSSSSSAISSSSSSDASSSSSGCGPFNTTLTTVLGAFPSVPDAYYADAIGMIFMTAGSSGVLNYNDLGPVGFGLDIEIRIGGNVVATVSTGLEYNGMPYSFVYGGTTYCSTFANGTTNF